MASHTRDPSCKAHLDYDNDAKHASRALAMKPEGSLVALKDGSPEDYGGAAARHFMDASSLREAGRLDNAGHLIGFAAECAIKTRISDLGDGGENPALHLPAILPAARKRLGQRANFATMFSLLKTDIFSDWHVDFRYSPDGKVTPELYTAWESVTKRLLAAAGIRTRLP